MRAVENEVEAGWPASGTEVEAGIEAGVAKAKAGVVVVAAAED